jgi:hypothetical protein
MAVANPNMIDSIFAALTPKKAPKGPVSITGSFQPQAPQNQLTLPTYREHLNTLYDQRISNNSQTLLKELFKTDPDVSATVGAYLTMADTPLTMLVYGLDGQIDTAAGEALAKIMRALWRTTDYTQGFTFQEALATTSQNFRYMLMLRGAVGCELIFDKRLVPTRLQQIDMASVLWYEKTSGVYKPTQKVAGSSDGVSLDIPSFFVAYHRRDPTTIYSNSDFVSAINTIASRQQVINDLYRIMQLTGFPRIDVKVLEEVVIANAPESIKQDPAELQLFAAARLAEVAANWGSLRSDSTFVHFDSVEAKILNDKNPGAGINIDSIIATFNAQNQAGLKTMATIIGRGESGVNTATVEARIFSLSADQLNVPLKQLYDQAFTFLLNVYGIPGFVECTFAPAEMRPSTELEPMLALRSARLLTDLSLGLITDEQYHMTVYGRPAPASAPQLSGTGFQDKSPIAVDETKVTPNSDPLGRSLAPTGSKAAKSNGVIKGK